jgi:hypothetical protein
MFVTGVFFSEQPDTVDSFMLPGGHHAQGILPVK